MSDEYVHPTMPDAGVSGYAPDGFGWAGKRGTAGGHLGPPLTAEQVAELPDRAEVTITWFGGNGPHAYRVLVDTRGQRRIEGAYCDPIPSFKADRITLGWDDKARDSMQRKREPRHITDRWAIYRGEETGC